MSRGFQRVSLAGDRNSDCTADLAHAIVAESAEAMDEPPHRDALDRIEVDRRSLRYRVIAGFEDHLARQAADRRRARSNQGPPQSRNRGVARQHDDRTATSVRNLTPPHLASRRQCAHEAPAALRKDARSPHSSCSSIGWES